MNEEEKKKLFIALVKEEEMEGVLSEIVNGEEYNMATDGGEPGLVHLLCLRLLEEIRGYMMGDSIVYDKEWREHVLYGDI